MPDPLTDHQNALRACRLCPGMQPPPVTGRPVYSRVMLVGQAPGAREPVLQRPFAGTAGRTLFRWFAEACGLDEDGARSRIYIAAVCRCFPGRRPGGGDRVPGAAEVGNCSRWLAAELALLRPALVIPVGRLAIGRFLEYHSLEAHVGWQFHCHDDSHAFDLIPLPHPSGASSWPRTEPGRTLLRRALGLIGAHPAMQDVLAKSPVLVNNP